MRLVTPKEMECKLGEGLRKLRLLKNLEQSTLAEQAGVSVRAIRNLEGGRGSTLATLMRVLKALGRESWLETVAPVPSISPLTMVRRQAIRQRARSKTN